MYDAMVKIQNRTYWSEGTRYRFTIEGYLPEISQDVFLWSSAVISKVGNDDHVVYL